MQRQDTSCNATQPTPIKTRGKKRAAVEAPPTSVKSCKIRKPIPDARSRRLSSLERLPLELIEMIFLRCLEVNLPRAAPRLGVALSSQSTLIRFCLEVFCSPKHSWGMLGKTCSRCEGIFFASPLYMDDPMTDGLPEHYYVNSRCRMNRLNLVPIRTLALSSKWAKWIFFRGFDQGLRKKDWFALDQFASRIPAKLLSWPLAGDDRKLFITLIAHGSRMDMGLDSLDSELVEDMFRKAACARDVRSMYALMVLPSIAYRPDRRQRGFALVATDWDLAVVRMFQCVRGVYSWGGSRGTLRIAEPDDEYPDDWDESWPYNDPPVMAALCETWKIHHSVIKWRLDREPLPPGYGGTWDML